MCKIDKKIMKASDFISKSDQNLIVKAIESAELETSGEIRVHIESKCKGDVIARAVYLFEKLKMDKTELHNGVLIYLAYDSCKFAIIGDTGINTIVPSDFWDKIKDNMLADFKERRFTNGVCSAISSAGKALKEFFPYCDGDVNEQSNEISFGDEE